MEYLEPYWDYTARSGPDLRCPRHRRRLALVYRDHEERQYLLVESGFALAQDGVYRMTEPARSRERRGVPAGHRGRRSAARARRYSRAPAPVHAKHDVAVHFPATFGCPDCPSHRVIVVVPAPLDDIPWYARPFDILVRAEVVWEPKAHALKGLDRRAASAILRAAARRAREVPSPTHILYPVSLSLTESSTEAGRAS